MSASTNSELKGFVAGIASGLTKLVIGHPFDSIKVRLQCAPKGFYDGALDCLTRTISKEGPRAVYKGAAVPAVGWILSDSILLGSLHNYRLCLGQYTSLGTLNPVTQTTNLSVLGHGIAGMLAGINVAFIAAPVELIKTKLQMQFQAVPTFKRSGQAVISDAAKRHYTSPWDCTKDIIKHQGVSGLYRQLIPTIAHRMNFGVTFATYEILMKAMRNRPKPLSEGTANFIAGGLSSFAFWIPAFPFDSVKNRLMSDSVSKPIYRGWTHAAKVIWSEGGIRAVYRGFTPCVLRAFPTNASALFVWESTMRLMGAKKVR